MKTLIVYTSKHGTTQKVAHYLSEKLHAQSVNLLVDDPVSLNDFELIILGGSIYYGSLHSKLTAYIHEQLDVLITKKIALFLVCLKNEETAAEQFNQNYIDDLLKHSLVDGFFGGVIEKSQLNPLEKVVTHLTFKNVDQYNGLALDEIDKFIEEVIAKTSLS